MTELTDKGLDVERLAMSIQSTILTSIDNYMGPGMGAYRSPWDDLTEQQKRHVIGDAKALAAEYQRLAASGESERCDRIVDNDRRRAGWHALVKARAFLAASGEPEK